jgi:hypothetical protein
VSVEVFSYVVSNADSYGYKFQAGHSYALHKYTSVCILWERYKPRDHYAVISKVERGEG